MSEAESIRMMSKDVSHESSVMPNQAAHSLKQLRGWTVRCKYKHTLCLKNVPPLTCYNLDIQDPTATIFGRSVTDKVRNQTMLCFPTSPI